MLRDLIIEKVGQQLVEVDSFDPNKKVPKKPIIDRKLRAKVIKLLKKSGKYAVVGAGAVAGAIVLAGAEAFGSEAGTDIYSKVKKALSKKRKR